MPNQKKPWKRPTKSSSQLSDDDDLEVVDMPGGFPTPYSLLKREKRLRELSSPAGPSISQPRFDVTMEDGDFEMSDDEGGGIEMDVFVADPEVLSDDGGSDTTTWGAGPSSAGVAGPSGVPSTSRSNTLSKEDVFLAGSSAVMKTPERMPSRSESASRLLREVRQQGAREGWIPKDWETRLSSYGYAS